MAKADEIELKYPTKTLPALPIGYKRSYLLLSYGYYKSIYPLNQGAAGGQFNTVGPLPFKGMLNYPYTQGQQYPDDEKHKNYISKFNTRTLPFWKKTLARQIIK